MNNGACRFSDDIESTSGAQAAEATEFSGLYCLQPRMRRAMSIPDSNGVVFMAEPMSDSSDSNVSPLFKAVGTADVELRDAPIPSPWILAGTPRARAGAIAHSPDGWGSAVIWECTAGSFRWQFGWEETVVILEGSVRVIAATGEERVLNVGDAAYFAQGTSSVWHIDSYLKKVAFTRNRVPAYVRKPLSAIQHVRATARDACQSFMQWNPIRKLVTAAVGLGGTLALFNMIVEM